MIFHCFSSLPKAHGLPFRGLSDFYIYKINGCIFLLVIGPVYTKEYRITASQKASFVYEISHFVYFNRSYYKLL